MIMNFKSPSCGWCGITSPPQLAACLSIASFLSEDILLLRSYLARFVLIHMHQKRWTVPSRSRHTLCESHEVFCQQRVNLLCMYQSTRPLRRPTRAYHTLSHSAPP